jgi:hypothetical protein
MGHEMRDDGGREATLDAAVRVTRIATDRFRLFVFLLLYNTHRKKKENVCSSSSSRAISSSMCCAVCI